MLARLVISRAEQKWKRCKDLGTPGEKRKRKWRRTRQLILDSFHVCFSKNIAFGYSDIQAKLRDATSVDRNGPSTSQLQELAAATHHP